MRESEPKVRLFLRLKLIVCYNCIPVYSLLTKLKVIQNKNTFKSCKELVKN
jgi:hypothetical protein